MPAPQVSFRGLPVREALHCPLRMHAAEEWVRGPAFTRIPGLYARLTWECLKADREDLAEELMQRGATLDAFIDEKGEKIWTQAVNDNSPDGLLDSQGLSQDLVILRKYAVSPRLRNISGNLPAHSPDFPPAALRAWLGAGGDMAAFDQEGIPVAHVTGGSDRIAFLLEEGSIFHTLNAHGETALAYLVRVHPATISSNPTLKAALLDNSPTPISPQGSLWMEGLLSVDPTTTRELLLRQSAVMWWLRHYPEQHEAYLQEHPAAASACQARIEHWLSPDFTLGEAPLPAPLRPGLTEVHQKLQRITTRQALEGILPVPATKVQRPRV